jgi:hypothetical protein
MLMALAAVPAFGLLAVTGVQQRRSHEAAVRTRALHSARLLVVATERRIEDARYLLIALSKASDASARIRPDVPRSCNR